MHWGSTAPGGAGSMPKKQSNKQEIRGRIFDLQLRGHRQHCWAAPGSGWGTPGRCGVWGSQPCGCGWSPSCRSSAAVSYTSPCQTATINTNTHKQINTAQQTPARVVGFSSSILYFWVFKKANSECIGQAFSKHFNRQLLNARIQGKFIVTCI